MVRLRERPKLESRKVLEHFEMQLNPYKLEDHGDGEMVWEDLPYPSLAEIVDFFSSKGVDLSLVNLDPSDVDYCDNSSLDGQPVMAFYNPRFYYKVLESEEEYNKRVVQYEQELQEYKDWYRENKAEIKATKTELKKQKEKEKDKSKKEKKLKKLRRELTELEVEIKNEND